MMTSVVADAAPRGNRDRVQPQTSHTSQPQKQIQATAEQIRLAQIIDKNDADFEGKVKQLIEVTSRNQDECMVALHDCNGDVNRAINFLLEEEVPVQDSWETVGKKKSVGKEGVTAETKERRVDKEGRGRGGPNRRGRGASRFQEGRTEENGFDSTLGERGERGRRGRGRGAGGRGRGRGDGVNRFSQGMGTFYTAEYTGSADPVETANDTTEGAGNWRNNLEDWAAEDWNEDLSETKVFTASFALASQNHMTPGQGVDLSSLLPKAEVDSDLVGLEPLSQEPLAQSLVFTNSQQHTARTQTHSYASAAANSYASAAAGTYAHAASYLGSRPPQPDVQKTEPVSVPHVTPLSNQTPVALTNGSPVAESSSPPPAVHASLALNEPKAEIPITMTHMDLKSQPDPSPILSQLTQQQNSTLLSDLPAQGRNPSPPLPLQDMSSSVLKPPGDTSAPTISESHQPKQIRPQRRRMPPPSKIPSSAVEMPGSADVSGLNVQFGALDFASEATVESTGHPEKSSQEPAPLVAQTQSNLYSKPSGVCEPVTGLPPALPTAAMEPRYTTPSVGLPTATAPSTSSRIETSSLHKEPTITTTTSSSPLTNGFSDARTPSTQDAVSSSTPQTISTALSSESGMSAASSLPSSSSSAPAPAPSTALPSLSSHVSSGTTLGSAVPATTGLSVVSDVSASLSAFSGSVLTSNGLSNGAPGLSTNSTSAPSTGRSAPLQAATTTSSKAPPNLPQGVPPLLANQYIMGPGGLLPAYPIYGYEDLQMIQSRLPIDYYGMPAFPGTTTLAARDGGLANNPYSGEATKFARGDAPSPVPTTSLASVAPSQSEPGTVPPQTQAPQNPGQAFLNPPLPPGYGYTSLPYYAGMPGVPSAFQYGPTVFMPPASAKQHAQYQHQAGYSGHTYASGFDDLSQAHGGGDYGKGYGGGSQSQAKPSNSAGKAPGLSGSASSDLGAAVYGKTQSFDKQGFPTASPATFSLPSALGGTGPMNPGGAPGYPPTPFLHILPPHQQPPSQLLHHHMAQDTQAQRSQSSSMQKSQGKSNYSSSPYWAN
ncbi:ubiquitin-associated protein 2b isoform 2-T4 [Clarias gariepinus]|uniref:ubiquitin-associated protein 2b isoform X2 n=1 Tax=Clarias gariepinus TaxID=13013 RepID=UPI00234CFF1C|nr:ubiquitin-associated protein 2b isoform X2 [Clarias gariepinus]